MRPRRDSGPRRGVPGDSDLLSTRYPGVSLPKHCPYLAGLFSRGTQRSGLRRHPQVPMYSPVSSAGRGEPRLRGRSGGLVSPGLLQSLSTLVLEDAYPSEFLSGALLRTRRRPAWEWITPGSLIGTLILLCVSLLFRDYVQNRANYGATYGSLAGVVILMSWLWICCIELLAAAELNKVIEDASPLGKPYGQRHENKP